jgi:hypothetical protein
VQLLDLLAQRLASLVLPRDKFRLRTPEEKLSTYTFNKHFIKHHFLFHLRHPPFAEAADKSGKPMAAINVRCLEDFDFASLPVKHFDGKSL